MNKKNPIYSMKLHEQRDPGFTHGTLIIRVPGGWIYRFWEDERNSGGDGQWSENYRINSVFVPFHNEFMYREEK